MNSIIVESFTLDHTKVIAPFIRLCTTQTGKKGDVVSKFDIRFAQPNKDEVPSAALHTLEHLLAGYLREELSDIIDLSPMGCRTGFYLTIWGTPSIEEVIKATTNSMHKVLNTTEVPAQNEIQCGNYKLHSLPLAKEWAKKVLDQGFSSSPFERILKK